MSFNRQQIRSMEERLEVLRNQGQGECDEAIDILQNLYANNAENERRANERWGALQFGLRMSLCVN